MEIDARFIPQRKSGMLEKYAGVLSRPYIPRIRRYTAIEMVPLGVVEDDDPRIKGIPALDGADRCADLRSIPPQAPGQTSAEALYLGYMRGEWGHFLLDSLNRMWALQELDLREFDEIVMCVESPDFQPGPNHRLVLRALGIEDKITYRCTPVRYRSLTVPDLNYVRQEHFGGKMAPLLRRVSEYLLSIATLKREDCPQNIFLTRSGLPDSRTRDINIDMIDTMMREAGYTIIHPERHSVADLAMMLHSARKIASTSGSAAHNMLFAPEYASAAVLERQALCYSDQIAVAMARSLDITYVEASLTPYPEDMGAGPFLWWPTSELSDYLGIPRRLVSPADAGRLASRYLACHRRINGRMLPVQPWLIQEGSLLADAILRANREIGRWLQRAPLWRRLAKKILRRR